MPPPDDGSPFHPGEQRVQERTGMRAPLERVGRKILRDFMPEQHREFFAELPFLVLGALDEQDRPWASAIFGLPGFVGSPDARTLAVDGHFFAGDPVASAVVPGAPIATLGIQLETRRRNRLNGTVLSRDGEALRVTVKQSFGNCAQYIQAREPRYVAAPSAVTRATPLHEGPWLSEPAIRLVERADTFFIASASAHPRSAESSEGVDVSHRGGRPGFVCAGAGPEGTTLAFPDFRGNFLFNTLGNLAVNPRAGLLFLDFDTGDVLTLTGEATVEWNGHAVRAFAGAERIVRFRVIEGRRLPGLMPLRWTEAEPAPQLPGTGIWADVDVR